MKLQTKLDKIDLDLQLDHSSKLLFSGSCFAENIGQKLSDTKFNCLINPIGISYNPLSLFNLLQRSIEGLTFTEKDLEQKADRFYSFGLHSKFSSLYKTNLLDNINYHLKKQAEQIKDADCIFLSLGTAWVHVHKESERLVNNCHKHPAKEFDKMLLNVDDIVKAWKAVFRNLKRETKIVFTVSPIRHTKDGLHENQLSKSTLILAVEEICKQFENCHYFPSYEIVMDELRDYRFYTKDLVHPNETAIEIIWEYFQNSCLSDESILMTEKINKIKTALQHRAFEPRSDEHQKFLMKLKETIIQTEKESKLDLSAELNEVNSKLNPIAS